jgi:hypothetical protein
MKQGLVRNALDEFKAASLKADWKSAFKKCELALSTQSCLMTAFNGYGG